MFSVDLNLILLLVSEESVQLVVLYFTFHALANCFIILGLGKHQFRLEHHLLYFVFFETIDWVDPRDSLLDTSELNCSRKEDLQE